jgi:hypothetical protein
MLCLSENLKSTKFRHTSLNFRNSWTLSLPFLKSSSQGLQFKKVVFSIKKNQNKSPPRKCLCVNPFTVLKTCRRYICRVLNPVNSWSTIVKNVKYMWRRIIHSEDWNISARRRDLNRNLSALSYTLHSSHRGMQWSTHRKSPRLV